MDLVGKGRHIRTVPVPAWVKETLDAWLAAAEIGEEYGDEEYGDSIPIHRQECSCAAIGILSPVQPHRYTVAGSTP